MTWTNWAENQDLRGARGRVRRASRRSSRRCDAPLRRARACGRRAPATRSPRSSRQTARSPGATDGLRGIVGVDAARRLVTALPGTTVAERLGLDRGERLDLAAGRLLHVLEAEERHVPPHVQIFLLDQIAFSGKRRVVVGVDAPP